MTKPVYDLMDDPRYAKAVEEYKQLIKQRDNLVVKYQEEARRLRKEADELYLQALKKDVEDTLMDRIFPGKKSKLKEEAEKAREAANQAEIRAKQAEKAGEWLDKAIENKNKEVASLAKEAAKTILPKIRADHAPVVARVARAMRELAVAVVELEEVRNEAASILHYLERWDGLCPRFPEAEMWIELVKGASGRYWTWLQAVKQAGFEVEI